MKYTKLLFLVIALLTVNSAFAQGIEQETEFLYIKAKYLYDTDRHEDAVNAFNKVINTNPQYKDALVLRAASKYGLAAYKGAIKDLQESMDLRGVTPDAVAWLALTYEKLGKSMQAKNTLQTAIQLDSKNPNLWMLDGELLEVDGELQEACQSYQKAAKLGNSKAKRKVDLICQTSHKSNGNRPKKKIFNQGNINDQVSYPDDKNNTDTDPKQDNTNDDMMSDDDEVLNDGDFYGEEEEEDVRPEFDPNEKRIIEIDEDLTIEIYGENLGRRRILDQPNILILSDSDGEVAVDICVSRAGKVKSAEYNGDLSTIRTQSLISLAIRKAKEFWFAKGEEKEACGVIVYKVKGS